MGHFAKVNNGTVVAVITAEQEFFDNFIDSSPGTWLQTSYNSYGGVHYGEDGKPDGQPALRKNFAGIGYSYHPRLDAFIPPKPYPSWMLDETSCLWQAPVPKPTDGDYIWDETTGAWVLAPTT